MSVSNIVEGKRKTNFRRN